MIHNPRRITVVVLLTVVLLCVAYRLDHSDSARAQPVPPARLLADSTEPVHADVSRALASPDMATISLYPPAGEVGVGQTFTVAVRIADLDTPLAAFQFDLNYDPSVISYVDAEAGDVLRSTGRSVICPAPALLTDTVRLACATTGDASGVTAPGDLAILSFTGLSIGQSDLTLSTIQLPTDARPPHLISNVTVQTATITITNTPPTLSGLPDQMIDEGTSLPTTIDLWAYASDAPTPDSGLTYTIENALPADVGVTLDGNRYVHVNPSTSWCGWADVTVRVTDPGELWDTDTFRVAVTWSCRGPLEPPGTPTLVASTDGGTAASRSPTFTWHVVADAEEYWIQVDDDANFSSPEVDETTSSTEYTPASALNGGTYTWRVRASNAAGAGAWSAEQEFTIPTLSPPEFKIYLPFVARNHPGMTQDHSTSRDRAPRQTSTRPLRPIDGGLSLAGVGLSIVLALAGYRPQRKRKQPRKPLPWRICSFITLSSLLLQIMPVGPAQAVPVAAPSPMQEAASSLLPAAVRPPTVRRAPLQAEPFDIGRSVRALRQARDKVLQQAGSIYWADLDGDHDVDEEDLTLIAEGWNCTLGDACYVAAYDLNGDEIVDAWDLAWVGNEYDVVPPVIAILSPAEGQVMGEPEASVTGTLTDAHAVVSVTVNGVAATLEETAFAATVPLEAGNQVLSVVAEDELGQKGLASRVVSMDGDGPAIVIRAPKHRQAVYTLTPTIAISYTDFYTTVNTVSLSALLVDEGGTPADVTTDLTVTDDGAWGTVSTPLAGDASYTLTVSLADAYGNVGNAHSTFYAPPDPEDITPPEEPENAGWVSGVIYDSSTCDEHLTQCPGLAGVRVTLAKVDQAALQGVRAARQRQIEARLASGESFTPLTPVEVPHLATPVSGTVVTGPDGFFAFPLVETGHYWLRAEKDGYTYGQREAEVVKERDTATNAIYLTPLDPAETPCDEGGCSHTSSDGVVKVDIPPGAIPAGEVITTTATNFEHVEFLPSGELPPGTQETYAFNLGGDSDYVFQEPIVVD